MFRGSPAGCGCKYYTIASQLLLMVRLGTFGILLRLSVTVISKLESL